MKKSARIEALVASLDCPPAEGDPRYHGWFACFNSGHYFEAHDVLEDLWLETTGPDYFFYKGLIQVAGAYVHLRKQAEHPDHPKHATRLRPGSRLFRLAAKNLAPFAPQHRLLNVEDVIMHCEKMAGMIEAADFLQNPWHCDQLPVIRLSGVSV